MAETAGVYAAVGWDAGGAGEYRLAGGGALWLAAPWGGGAGEYLDALAAGEGRGPLGD